MLKDNTLQAEVNNSVFGPNPWFDVTKSLVVVYQYGRNPPLMKIVEQDHQVSVGQTVHPCVGLLSTKGLLNHGDMVTLNTVNGLYISLNGSNDKLITRRAIPREACAMTIFKEGHDDFFKMKCQENGKYVTVNTSTDAGSTLYATGSGEQATKFSISISMDGSLRLATAEGMYVTLDIGGNSLRANSMDHLGAGSIFGIAFKRTTDRLSQDANSLSDHDLAWASFIWKLTGGFFFAIGLGHFISADNVKSGVLELIKRNQTAWKAIQDLVKEIADELGSEGTLIVSMLFAVHVLYLQGLLWIIFKEMLKSSGWTPITWPLAKIIQVIFLREAEAVRLLASFTEWGVQTVEAGLAVFREYNCYSLFMQAA